jgi:antitoxin ParD1/3/4
MRSTQQLSSTLLIEMAASTGECGTESEAIREGILAPHARDHAVDTWLSQTVAPVYDATKIDPTRGRSPASVKESLTQKHKNMAEGSE